ncbi:FAD-binding oxidoreductase [Lampropedia puyangensis]|uniref:FAD-binding oxidoreductase n=1 Tax=Lampropedia puyangensis TaxID=1330072 RepID=A0A4S8FC58_9BURK|nr:FAD-binding oxidoreductase [Lampropedia puyangensis]THU05218.1 FAD-binding oxidoreductase [Lampropedia puyangensis]
MKGDTRSHGLWEASAPPAPECTVLTENPIKADVVVVGGGYTGLSTALHLAIGGASVVLLEGEQIGFGGSGRNCGLVNAGMWVKPRALPDELGQVYGSRLLHLLTDAPSVVYGLVKQHGMECEAINNGTLHCAVGQSGLKDVTDRWQQWRELGAPVELLDADAIARATGTSAFSGGLLDKRAGTIQPLGYARGLAHAARAAGVRLYEHSAVVSTQDHGTHWQLNTASGSVEADWVVVATNAYTKGVWPQLHSEIVRLPFFNLATEPLSREVRSRILPGLHGAWDTRSILTSFRLDMAGRLILGSVGALRGPGLTVHRRWARKALVDLFPELRDVDFEHEWYGQIGMTSNALPRFHELGRQTLSFSGYNGRGIAPGTVFGREIARLILGEISMEEMPLPVTPIATVSCKAVREAFYEAGAQVASATGVRF